MLPKTSAHVKSYDRKAKCRYFLIEDHDLSEEYNTIRDKISTDIKQQFNN